MEHEDCTKRSAGHTGMLERSCALTYVVCVLHASTYTHNDQREFCGSLRTGSTRPFIQLAGRIERINIAILFRCTRSSYSATAWGWFPRCRRFSAFVVAQATDRRGSDQTRSLPLSQSNISRPGQLLLLCSPTSCYSKHTFPSSSPVYCSQLTPAIFFATPAPVMAALDSTAPTAGHRRNKSAAAIKSFIQKRSTSDGTQLSKNTTASLQTPLLPPDHPHSSQLRAAGRPESGSVEPTSPHKSRDTNSSPKKSLHKKTLSSVSLRSLAKKEERSKDKHSTDARRSREDDKVEDKPKKAKSSTNLAAMFGKSKRDRSPVKEIRDKENTSPMHPSDAPTPVRTPIWAEFSTQQEMSHTTVVPLNDTRRSVEAEISLYNPQNYSPTKQRSFFDVGQPSLQQRSPAKPRPKSMVVPKTASATSILETFSRKKSSERVPLSDTKGNEGRVKETLTSRSIPSRPILARASTDLSRSDAPFASPMKSSVTTKKQSRVMAAVAALNGKARQAEVAPPSPTKLDPSIVDAEFEEVLVSNL